MDSRPLKALIIDADGEARLQIQRCLQAGWPGVRVAEADSTDAALAAATEADVVLLDHQTEDHNGLGILRMLKSQMPEIPVIYMTSSGDETLAARAFESGADDYLPKSRLDADAVARAIRETQRHRQPASQPPVKRQGSRAGNAATGVHIPGFEVRRRLSNGALSSVYLATEVPRGRTVAVKILRGLVGDDNPELLERFLREYQAVSRIDHRHIVKIYDVGVADDQIFISMEYLAGGTLRSRLSAAPMREDGAVTMALDVCAALGAIHEAGILHRDLKPGNILLRDDGGACLIDFGLAKHLQIQQELTVPGRIYGTPYYMSPEQGQGLEIDRRSDLYSLGVIFHEMLTGRKPYLASTPVALVFKHCHAPLPVLPDEFRPWQGVVDSLMAKDPADRPPDAAAVRDILTSCNHCKVQK